MLDPELKLHMKAVVHNAKTLAKDGARSFASGK
jgi:hypothetical protein